ncbi:hypothetical protein ScPMuIL_013632 [Solemya velum]
MQRQNIIESSKGEYVTNEINMSHREVMLCLGGTPWKACEGSSTGKVSNVIVSGCSGQKCILKKGTTVDVEMDFAYNDAAPATKTTAVVHGIIAGLPVPFSIPHPDGCTGSGLTCPLKQGQQYKYKSQIPVKSDYPSIRVVVKWELQDENSKDIFCVTIPAEIKS